MDKQEYASLTRSQQCAAAQRVRPRSVGSMPRGTMLRDQVDRVKTVCHQCGYKSFPQWMNDQARCLKCNAVLRARPTCHQQAACRTPDAPMPAGQSCQQLRGVSKRPSSATYARHVVRDAFRKLDVNGDGVISLAEMKEVMQNLPMPADERTFNDADLEHILEEMDDNFDGLVDYPDFTSWLMHDGEGATEIMRRLFLSEAVQKVELPARKQLSKSFSDARFDSFWDGTATNRDGLTDVLEHAPASMERVTGAVHSIDCRKGGKCIFKFSRCKKCGRGEGALAASSVVPLPNLLSSSSGARRDGRLKPERSNSTSRMYGPERFFYDRSSYTGAHANGGPAHVAKGSGTAVSSFWLRH